MKNGTDLEKISDKQKMLLSQLGYLNINDEGFKKIQEEGLTLEQLTNYLDEDYADKPYIGNLGNNKKIEEFVNNENAVPETIIDIGAGKRTISTERELLQELIDEGLGDLRITDIIANNNGLEVATDGLNAMAFEDENGNKGISYGGSDFDIDAIGDWVTSDVGEWLTNESLQAEEANKFFEKNKDENGKNYIYGHSLGGNLTAHTYVDNYNEIAEAFTINGTPINTNELSDEQIEALNDSKYNCNVVGLDPVSQLKDYSDYAKNVNYITNNGEQGENPLYAHTVQAATYDENGNFIYEESKEKAYDGTSIISKGSKAFTDTAKTIRNGLNGIDNVKDKFSEITGKVKENEEVEQASGKLKSAWGKITNLFKEGYSKASNFMKNTYDKGKNFVLNIGKEEIKLLESGQSREQTETANIKAVKESARNSFIASLNPMAYVNDTTYTQEDALAALSSDKSKLINNNNRREENMQSSEMII